MSDPPAPRPVAQADGEVERCHREGEERDHAGETAYSRDSESGHGRYGAHSTDGGDHRTESPTTAPAEPTDGQRVWFGGHAIHGAFAWTSRHWRLLLFLTIVGVGVGLDRTYERWGPRSILLEADTGTLAITLTETLAGKTFATALVCEQRQDYRGAPNAYGCPTWGFELSKRQNVSYAFPPGSELSFEIYPDRLDISVLSIPDEHQNPRLRLLERGGITIREEEIGYFGQMVAFGCVRIGVPPGSSDTPPLTAGRYRINSETLFRMLLTMMSDLQQQAGFPWLPLPDEPEELVPVREGQLFSGAYVALLPNPVGSATPGQDVCLEQQGRASEHTERFEARVQIVPVTDGWSDRRLRTTVLSGYQPVDLEAVYYQSEPIRIRPSLIDVALADPMLILVTTLAAGLVALIELLKRSREQE